MCSPAASVVVKMAPIKTKILSRLERIEIESRYLDRLYVSKKNGNKNEKKNSFVSKNKNKKEITSKKGAECLPG